MSHEPESDEVPSRAWWAFPPLRDSLLAGLIAGSAFVLERFGLLRADVAVWAYLIAIPLGGWHWMREGFEKLVAEHAIGIEALMVAATAASAILRMWEEAAALVVLYGAAEGLEEFTYSRTRASLRALLDLVPKQARVLRDGHEQTVAAETLRPGERFVVRPGESIATDGTLIEGRSGINEAPVTGESIPVDKVPGMSVFAGSINGEGVLLIEAARAYADNTLSRIIHLVESAQAQKGPAQRWIERFGRRYSPAVLFAAVLTATVPWLLGMPASEWAHRAVVLLVAAAPCALIMSMPMAMAAGIGAAGRRGILIKGGVHLEHLSAIRVVAFDKTGTLTGGRPTVTDVIPVGTSENEFLAAVAAVEHYSQHPLARAIVRAAEARGLALKSTHNFSSLTGAGAEAMIDGATWTVGSPALFAARSLPLRELEDQIAVLQDVGKTVVLAQCEGQLRGVLALQDQPRPEAREVIARLHALGQRTVMLTGDNRRTAEAIARELGIDDVRSDLKPDRKVEAVRQLHREYGPVLMVGDGVNDAPALTCASCGVAMGMAGADAALEAADIALMKDDLHKVVEALVRGCKARRVSLQNIAFSVAVLLIMIPLAVGGVIGVALAVLVHETAELLAVANGLRAGAI